MGYPDEDVAELFEQTCRLLLERMGGVDDREWAWQPIAGDEKVTIRWRLDHIAEAVGGARNWEWLDARPTDAPRLSPADSAEDALATVDELIHHAAEAALIRDLCAARELG